MMFGKKRTPEEDVMSLKEQRAMLGDRLSFAASEAYKLLRTNLTFALPDEQRCRVVGITSASRSEGKSTTSINLAYTIAETGKRVLLVDDVITTGATAAACAQALLDAGAHSVFAVAMAVTENEMDAPSRASGR